MKEWSDDELRAKKISANANVITKQQNQYEKAAKKVANKSGKSCEQVGNNSEQHDHLNTANMECPVTHTQESFKSFMQDVLRKYEILRGLTTQSTNFWDVVVLTACNADQEEAFNLQLERKVLHGALPASRYLVVPDEVPVKGCKIGAGGSTFLVIKKLKECFPAEELAKKRVLLIHAGGWSQRLPSASVLGKLFMPLPIGGSCGYDMLDIKLALYLPFLPLMPPGIFLTASDDIELFDINTVKLLASSFPIPSGFVALGHPSTIEIGRTHGVFACELAPNLSEAAFLTCSRVLQKPTVDEMRTAGAIRREGLNSAVITDSAYWFDMAIVEKLYEFYVLHGLPEVEVDCYGDFMQPLGSSPSMDYIERTKNNPLKRVRELLFEKLAGSSFNVLFLPGSLFIHLGTMPEYLDCLLRNHTFRDCFNITSNVIHSALHAQCVISKESILEYCDFSSPVTVEPNCLISGCSSESSSTTDVVWTIPADTFMHTVVLKVGDERQYCTIFCGIDDDIKASVEAENAAALKIFGREISPDLITVHMQSAVQSSSLCIWNLSIFPVCRLPGESFVESLRIIRGLTNSLPPCSADPSRKFVSMSEAVQLKDIRGMTDFRDRLRVSAVRAPDQVARKILDAGVEAVKPGPLVQQHVQVNGQLLKITDFNGDLRFSHVITRKIWLLTVGKAAVEMMDALLAVFGDFVEGAVLLVPSELRPRLLNWNKSARVQVLFGGKGNMANLESIQSTTTILDYVRAIRHPDIFIFAISGGASALLVAPAAPVTLTEKLHLTTMLMRSGAPIQALNTVRGALSEVKSGGLLQCLQPGVVSASLILSDIIGDPIHMIGGGPTVPCETQHSEAIAVLQRFGLWDGVSDPVKAALSVTSRKAPTKVGSIENILIGNNTLALRTCQQAALELGYQTLILTASLDGDSRLASAKLAELARAVISYRNGTVKTPPHPPFLPDQSHPSPINWNHPFCLLAGGETTTKVTGSGLGGRNQEMVLAFAVALQTPPTSSLQTPPIPSLQTPPTSSLQTPPIPSLSPSSGVFISCGTDGQDGPTDAGGAAVRFPSRRWSESTTRAAHLALQENDSYNFFAKHGPDADGGLIKPGLTGTNVMDLQILLMN
ncbi:Fucose-1-phosphate guanylyltransferase [Hypsibius exemplaris]|uniref:Fucose-1-phosphate guanylyltransferase n=1 Tax=Hypsibius exemplaris TaxID=2072580 RepID=A0A1W0WTJ3_HYPEX|nr:Fucose-1-phosphate guanylyltransferase [Hypsibius exemplaris]